MNEVHMDHQAHHRQTGLIWYRVGLWGALAIMSYLLLTEHLAHVIYFLPFLLLLACPFMHMFMHHDHGEHGNHTEAKGPN
jgi:4-hydroxybenzoate polyprenyltransferase